MYRRPSRDQPDQPTEDKVPKTLCLELFPECGRGCRPGLEIEADGKRLQWSGIRFPPRRDQATPADLWAQRKPAVSATQVLFLCSAGANDAASPVETLLAWLPASDVAWEGLPPFSQRAPSWDEMRRDHLAQLHTGDLANLLRGLRIAPPKGQELLDPVLIEAVAQRLSRVSAEEKRLMGRGLVCTPYRLTSALAEIAAAHRTLLELESDGALSRDALANLAVALESGIIDQRDLMARLQRHPEDAPILLPLLSVEQQLRLATGEDANESDNLFALGVLALDLESDGKCIHEIGIYTAGEAECLFDDRNGGHGRFAELGSALEFLALTLISARLVIGHNLLDWDLPILRRHLPGLPTNLPVWDTLLVSWLLDPIRRGHALGGSHHADEDAAATWSLFCEQAAGLSQETLARVLSGEAETPREILALALAAADVKRMVTRERPVWLDPPALFARGQGRILLERPRLKVCSWVPGVSVVDDADPELDMERMLAAARNPPGDDSSALIVSLGIFASACLETGVQVRESMLPYWLLDPDRHPEVERVLRGCRRSTVADPDRVLVLPLNDVASAADGILVVPTDAEALVVATQDVEPPEGLALAEPGQRPASRLLEHPGHGSDSTELLRFDATRARLPESHGSAWSRIEVRTLTTLEQEPLRETPPGLPPVGLLEAAEVSLHPGTAALHAYWCQQLARFLTACAEDAGDGIALFVVTSSRSRRLLDLLADALAQLGHLPEAHRDWSIARWLQAGIVQKRSRFACLLEQVPVWLDAAETTSGTEVALYLEAMPLDEWWCATPSLWDRERVEPPEAEAEAEAEASDQRDLEEAGQEEMPDAEVVLVPDSADGGDAEDWVEVSPARILGQLAPLIRTHFCAWAGHQGLGRCARVVLLDPRLGRRHASLIRGARTIPTRELDLQQRQVIETALDALRPPAFGYTPPDVAVIEAFVRDRWGFEALREHQRTAIGALVDGSDDVLVALPTGEGKSVLFQAPALHQGLASRRLTLVISPLRALMRDQVEGLHRRPRRFHQSADYLSADRPWHEIEDVLQGVLDGRVLLLYVAPERLRSERFCAHLTRRLGADGRFGYLVVDEAHCLSQWGYSFRPDYLFALDRLTSEFRDPVDADTTPLLFFSATVTKATSAELDQCRHHASRNLRLVPDRSVHPVRSHIQIETEPIPGSLRGPPEDWVLDDRLARILEIIAEGRRNRERTDQVSAVILFVRTRRQAEHLARLISRRTDRKEQVDHFHAGLDAESRSEVYERYKRGLLDVLVCTKAFGMGMDIPHIHFAIHLSPPLVLEDYLQEVGRIGRGREELERAGLERVTATLLHGDEDFAYNQELAQRARIGVDEIKDLWRQLAAHSRPAEDIDLALMPTTGFSAVRAGPESRERETRLRMCLFWLECCKRLTIVGQAPGLLRVRLMAARLDELVNEPDHIGEVATALSGVCRNLPVSVQRERPAASKASTQTETRSQGSGGLIGRIASFLGRLVGISLGPAPAPAPQTQLEPALTSTPVSEPALESIIDVPSLFRATTVSGPDALLSTLRKIEKRGGLEMLHELELKPKALSNAPPGQIRELFDSLLEAAGDIAATLTRRPDRRLKLDDMPLALPSLCREGRPLLGARQPEPPMLHPYAAEDAVLYLLRVSMVRVLEIESEGDRPQWSLWIGPRDAKGLRERVAAVMQLAREVWSLLRGPISANAQSVRLSSLVDSFRDRAFNRYLLKSALGLLSKLHLCAVSDDLLGMTYVLALTDVGTELSVAEEVEKKLDGVNRMSELRAHAMEIYAYLDVDARRAFIDGYFQIARPEDLEVFLTEQMTFVDAPSSERMQTKLAQIRKEAIEERFACYQGEDALEPHQWRAISHPRDQHLLVLAGPGAGKTRVLIDRIVYLIDRAGLAPSAIMVLAFNRAIVHEIRIRLRETFDAVGYGAMVRHVRVHTFHGLAARLLRRVGDGDDLLGELTKWLASPGNAVQAADGLRAILVDEYQDVDSQREAVLFRLQEVSGASLFAIGDDDQDILGFTYPGLGRVGSPGCERFERFGAHFGLEEHQHLQLRINFRSDKRIVEFSNKLIKRYAEKNPNYRRLKTEPLSSVSPDDGIVNYDATRENLLNGLKTLVPKARDGGRSIAILCRTNDEVVEVAESLQNVVDSVEIRTSDPYAVDQLRHHALFLDAVRQITNNDSNPLLTDPRIDDLLEQWQQLAIPEAADGSPFGVPRDLVNLVLKQNRFARTQDLLNVAAMKSDELVRILKREQTKGCIVSTIHRVKGLEFDEVVLLPSTAPFPFGHQGYRQDLARAAAEEIRLFYVGMTRARHVLLFGWRGEREKAWWERNYFAGEGSTGPVRRVLGGRLDEVDISWAGRSQSGETLQDDIERLVRVGDLIEVEDRRLLVHKVAGRCRRIGALKRGILASSASRLRVAAIYRYPQVQDPSHPEYWEWLTDQVRTRGWSYVVLVTGYLSTV